MFEIDSERTSLPLSPDKVLALVASLNAPLVVAADMPVEPTRAYICAFRDGFDEVSFSIYLHCVESNKGAFYRYDGGRIPQSRFDEVMGEAMAFAESLGFMMDDLGFRGLDAARRDELMRETPMFVDPSARAVQKAAPEPPEPAVTSVVDESVDAGLVGATPISPIPSTPPPPEAPSPPAPPAQPVPAPPPPAPQAAAAPTPPLQTVFVPPPSSPPAASPPAPARQSPPARAGSAPAPAPAPPIDVASDAADSGAREIELTIDTLEAEPAAPAPAAATSAPPAAPSPSPAREAPGAPQSAARSRQEAPHGSARAVVTPGVAAAAQALVRLLASL